MTSTDTATDLAPLPEPPASGKGGGSGRGTRLHRYGPLNTHDLAKLLAMLSMTIGHVGFFLMPEWMWCRVVGRVGILAFCFLVGYAAVHAAGAPAGGNTARNRASQWWLLGGGAYLVALDLFTGYPALPLAILVNLALCRWVAGYLHARGQEYLQRHLYDIFLVCLLLFIPSVLLLDYGTLALLFVVLGVAVRMGLHGTRLKVYTALSALFYISFQQLNFGFDAAQGTVAAALCLLAILALYHYRVRTFPVALPEHSRLTPALKWLSRYSLVYYVGHRTVFELVGWYFGMPEYIAAYHSIRTR